MLELIPSAYTSITKGLDHNILKTGFLQNTQECFSRKTEIVMRRRMDLYQERNEHYECPAITKHAMRFVQKLPVIEDVLKNIHAHGRIVCIVLYRERLLEVGIHVTPIYLVQIYGSECMLPVDQFVVISIARPTKIEDSAIKRQRR